MIAETKAPLRDRLVFESTNTDHAKATRALLIEAINFTDMAVHAKNQQVAGKDAAYSERNQLVALLAALDPAGTKRTAIEGWDPEWHNCVYVDLPTGQASWHYHDSEAHLFAHLPAYPGEWDGHTTTEKYQRIARLRWLA